jgi:hypothetical protein
MKIAWPEGKAFAFTIFDDPDAQILEDGKRIYSLLSDLGLRTTKAVWPLGAIREPNSGGDTCADARYLEEALALQQRGFEIGYHNATLHSSTREETIRGLDAFKAYFGDDPKVMANHYNEEAIYWGPARVTDKITHTIYNIVTLGRNKRRHFGHVPGHPSFWGDVCRQRIRYCRNFVFSDINTLRACPWMPYHDPKLQYVNAWYSSSEGSNISRFLQTLTEENQDRLESENGACIMYTHFGHGFVQANRVNQRFQELMDRLSRKNGWFVPVGTLLDFIAEKRQELNISPANRSSLEKRWLWEKLFRGTS